MHYKTTQFKQVQAKDGGIVRTIHVESLDISVEDVLNYGRDIFFEGGYSKYGRIEDTDVTLGDCKGQQIAEFQNLQDSKCSLGAYLKARGLFVSKCTLYFLSKPRAVQSTHDTAGESRQQTEPPEPPSSLGPKGLCNKDFDWSDQM